MTLDWHRVICPDNGTEIQAVEADGDRYLGYVRVVSRRAEVTLEEPIVSIPGGYEKLPLLR